MAEVWEVEDTRLGVHRALKVLPAGNASDADTRARLAQEARILARLSHPHIVRVLDVGEEPNGRAWLVMELVPGGTLEGWIDRTGPLHPREAGRVLLGLLDALALAHAAGVIHRDVKPQNLLVATDAGGRARLQLADFGIARLRDAQDLTHTGTLLGSWALMAPEQRMDARHVGPASDVFAAAGTLVWMVHGAPVSDLHVQEHRTALLASWPPTLAGVCHRALAFRPEQRFHSAGAFAEALRFALAQEEELSAVRPGSRPWAEGGFEVELGEVPAGSAIAAQRAEVTDTTADSWDGGGPAPLRNASPGAGRVGVSHKQILAWGVAACALGAGIGAVAGDAGDVLEQVGVVEVPDSVAQERAWAALPVCDDSPDTWQGSVVPRRITGQAGGREAGGVRLVDLDGDGFLDLLGSYQVDEIVRVWWGDGDRVLPETGQDIPSGRTSGTATDGIDAGDIDGDGRLDIVALALDRMGFVVLRQTGQRTFGPPVVIDNGLIPNRVALLDMDADGRDDLLYVTLQRHLSWRKSEGTGFGSHRILAENVDTFGVVDVPGARKVAVLRAGVLSLYRVGARGDLGSAFARWDVPFIQTNGVHANIENDPAADTVLYVWGAGREGRFTRVVVSAEGGVEACRYLPFNDDVFDAGDWNADGIVDVATQSTCSYCTSAYTLGLGARGR